jgi:hypothetical protein
VNFKESAPVQGEQIYEKSIFAPKPLFKRLAGTAATRCIGCAWMYLSGFTVFIALGITSAPHVN